MKRREFIAGFGGAAAFSFAARAQQAERKRRIGVVFGGLSANDPAGRAEMNGFRKGLAELSWTEGRNIEIIFRNTEGDVDLAKKFAQEVVTLSPDIVMARSTPAALALKAETRTIPIVFVQVSEPVSSGLVRSLARPGGNVTGFTNFEASVGGKWLDLLKEVAPRIRRVSVAFNPSTAPYYGLFLRSAEAAGPRLGIEVAAAPVKSDADIESIFTAAARAASGVLQVPDSFLLQRRETMVSLAAKHRVPVIYSYGSIPAIGGLMAYAVDTVDLFRRAAGYVDRVLKGTNPQDLPVQQPTKFVFVINRKTANTLGLKIPDKLLFTADEVIE